MEDNIPKMYQGLFNKIEKGEYVSPREHIKAKCLSCSCFQTKEITHCPVKTCPLIKIRPYQAKSKVRG